MFSEMAGIQDIKSVDRFQTQPNLENGQNPLQKPPIYLKVKSTPHIDSSLAGIESINSNFKLDEYYEDILQTQSQIKEWINTQKRLILSQFMELMKAIAPQITPQDATEIFNRMDASNNGSISTETLLQNHFLSRIISKLTSTSSILHHVDEDIYLDIDDSEIHNDHDASKIYNDMSHEELIEEITKLNTWILKTGKPSIARVKELKTTLSVYEMEQNNHEIEISTLKEQLSTIKEESKTNIELMDQSSTSLYSLTEDYNELRLKVAESDNKFKQQYNDLKECEKELERQKKLAEQLRVLNAKYLKQHHKITQENRRLQDELNEVKNVMLLFENEAVQRSEEAQVEINELRNTLKCIVDKEENVTFQPLVVSPAITKIHVLETMEATRTPDPYLYRIPSKPMFVQQVTEPMALHEEHATEYDENVQSETVRNDVSHLNDIEMEIRKKMEEEYELKLQQNDIDHQFSLGQEKQRAEEERNALIQHYNALLDEQRNKQYHMSRKRLFKDLSVLWSLPMFK